MRKTKDAPQSASPPSVPNARLLEIRRKEQEAGAEEQARQAKPVTGSVVAVAEVPLVGFGGMTVAVAQRREWKGGDG